jgi:hypothetical protein
MEAACSSETLIFTYKIRVNLNGHH